MNKDLSEVVKTVLSKIKPLTKETIAYLAHLEQGCGCLNCGRCVLVGGPCCSNPRYVMNEPGYEEEASRLKALADASKS